MSAIRRRLVTIPLYFALAGVTVATAPLWIPLLALVDALRPGRSAALRCGLAISFYLLCEALGLLAAGALWPAGWLWPERSVGWNRSLQQWWASSLWHGSLALFSARVEVEGGDQVAPGPILLLLRHASVVDTLIPSVLVSRDHHIELRYVMKRELLWDPCLDIVGHRLPNYFVDRRSEDGAREALEVARLAGDLPDNGGVLIYPEGTRFTQAKRERILRRLSEDGDPLLLERAKRLERTLPPRLGGILALLDASPESDVVFCAHTGLEGAGSFWDLWNGSLVRARVRGRFWRVPRSEIPEGRERRAAWLFDHWARIDAWLLEEAVPIPA